MNDTTKVLVALLAGAVAGAALGILFAPDSGSDTRDKLSDALKDLGDSIKDRVVEELENLTNLKDSLVDDVKSEFGDNTYRGVPNPSTTQSESYSS